MHHVMNRATNLLSYAIIVEHYFEFGKLSSWRHSILVRTLVLAGELPYPALTASWMCDYLAVKPSAIGQPTWPTQLSIPHGSVNE